MNLFPAARAIFKDALNAPRSSFYRDLYADRIPPDADFPRTPEEWRRVPVLTKQDLMRVPFEERLFEPHEKIDAIRCTSSTTGTGILCVPRTVAGLVSRYQGMRIVSFYIYHHLSTWAAPSGARVVAGDRGNLPATALLASRIEADTLHGSPSLILALAEHLSSCMDLKKIQYLLLGNEHMSELQLRALGTLYPNASTQFIYAMAESGGPIAISPIVPVPGYPRALAPFSGFLVEVLDESGKPCEAGEAGDMLVTSLYEHQALPLIRYKTKDRALMLPSADGTLLFEMLGRAEDERVRLEGGELYLSELERAILSVAGSSALDFEAVVTEELVEGLPKPQLSLTIFTREPAPLGLAEALSTALRINQTRSYEDAVRAKLMAPLAVACKPMEAGERKRRHLLDTRA